MIQNKYFIWILITLLQTKSSESDCNVIINEADIDNLEKLERNEFIELKSYCDQAEAGNYPLRSLKVIGITAKNNRVPTIDLVATLWNERTDNSGYYVIGGLGIENANMKINSDYIKCRKKLVQNSMNNFLTNGNDELHAILLLNGKSSPLSTIVLTTQRPVLPISQDVLKVLNEFTVDMIVYGRRAPSERCDIFEQIYPDFTNMKYALRDYDTETGTIEYSLNRCGAETNGFLPGKIKLGIPSPGQENDCRGPHFILEDHLENIADSTRVSPMNYELLGETEDNYQTCTSRMDASQYYATRSDKVHSEVQTIVSAVHHDVCTSLQLYPEHANSVLSINVANSRKRAIDDVYADDYDWDTTKYFK